MIYLDVTGGCTLPLQSGIPRTTRAIARLARFRLRDVMPIRWQPFRGTYTRLSPRASALLEDRPSVLPPSHRAPRDTTGPLLMAALRDLIPPWPKAEPLHRTLRAADTLLLTSLFPDNRIGYLEKLATAPGRKVAIFHDAIPLRDPNVSPWERQRHIHALKLLATMDLVIAVSGAARSDLLLLMAEHALAIPKITIIHWPVPFEASRPAFVAPPPEKVVLYVSRLKQVKNHAALLAACEILWREDLVFSLTLIGCEDEARESAAIRHEIRRLQRCGRAVEWRAQVSEDDLHNAYRRASFTVFPSRREGFGLPIVESFWHGRGVICSGDEAMGEVSRGPGAIRVDVINPEEIATAMRKLLTDDAACMALAQAAYARPQRTWDDYATELERCLTP
jgi:glycosyltransferase involved in cell wall biosynthesis